MNALPVGPRQVQTAESRSQYFSDLEKWGFDIAYNAFYADLYDDVVGSLKEAYKEFATEAHRKGYMACIQIQSTVCAGDRVGIEEAQYDIDNNPQTWGEHGFFASFSSDAWRSYLKELTTIFVSQYGYDCVVFEEPMYRVDIPGTKDRFHEKFLADHPGANYPKARAETAEYLAVQKAKGDSVIAFYADLAAHAKSVGAKKVGVMPWFFIPTTENTPGGTLNTSCNISQLSQIPDLDLLVARMQPDNIFVDVMRTGDELQKSPVLYYMEVMAHALGKDLIAVNNPTDEHTDYPALPLIPFEFYRDATLACLAAAPTGFTRHWYGQNHGKDEEHMKLLTEVAEFASRLGQPVSPVAFVFSYSGTQHADPLTYETVFSHYWALAKHLAINAHLPILTFHADTLDRDLAQHPDVKVLVFEEHFPLSAEQMLVIRDWWQGSEKRAVVAFGSGLGYAADVNLPGERPCAQAFPGVLELIGLRQEALPQIVSDTPIEVKDVSRVRRSAFLGGQKMEITKLANTRRIFGSRANVLYEVEIDDTAMPVVAEWRDRATLAVFCGFGLSEETAEAAEKAIRYAIKEADCPPMIIDSCSEGILWNININDFLVIVNTSDNEGTATGRPGRATFWDCRTREMLPDGDPVFKIPPHSFQVYRVVGRRSKFYDLIGASSLRRVIDGAGRADIEIHAGRKTTIVLRASPKEIHVDGKSSTITQQVINDAYHVTLQQCPPGEHRISLRW